MRDDEATRHGRHHATVHLLPTLPPTAVVTPLQTSVSALLDLLTDARHELTGRERETFYDIALIRLARDSVALGLDQWCAA